MSRFPCAAGDIYIADRGYAKPGDLRRVMVTGADFVVIATNLGERYSAPDILDLYRMRWQIEFLFKRFKSLMGLGKLPAKCPKLARTWILAKLVMAFLAEHTARKRAESSP